MLERVLEPEVMDSAAEASDYDAMDHSHVNQLFVDDLLQLHHNFTNPERERGDEPTLLDVGTGTAQIPIALCQKHPKVHIVAIDMAQHMLRVGKANVQRAGVTDRVRL